MKCSGYLLNCHECLQLGSGVRDALNNLKQSCPQYADRFAGNAAGYLEIGDAIAEAMLKLRPKHSK